MEQDDKKLTVLNYIWISVFILFIMSAESIVLWFCDLIGS